MIKRWLGGRTTPPRLQVLMVCMGNICRSPMAEGVLRGKLAAAGLQQTVAVDSAGTSSAHRGEPPDPRAQARAQRRGWSLAGQKSRPVVDADFERFDWLLAMDHDNLDWLRERCPEPLQARLGLLLPHEPTLGRDEVPDPYYGSLAGFDLALDLIEPACDGLVQQIRQRLASPP